jgi:hypothetical protein
VVTPLAAEPHRASRQERKEEGIRVTGGAQVGWVNVSWPLATLSVSSTKLVVSGFLIGSYSFGPADVVAVESYGSVPILGRGVRIVHARTDYAAKIIFWSFRDPDRIIEDIRRSGFSPNASPATVRARSGMPFRWSAVILFVVAWNVLFLLDRFGGWNGPQSPGVFALLALALVFSTTIAVQRSARVQGWILQPGRSITEVRPFIGLLQMVTGFMLIGFSLFRFL